MGDPKRITVGDESCGIAIEYIKRRKMLSIWCWYDGGYGGMDGEEIPLADFLTRLGIEKQPDRPREPVRDTTDTSEERK